ncbi:MAG: hypothetical protein G01um101433_145 [Parcubacteria group bacterium Gr01-1014_33]|nr:MAG: hypothetical protein G01um101433_145 [Parcubacteria group bacterium Gr01-1014_33]
MPRTIREQINSLDPAQRKTALVFIVIIVLGFLALIFSSIGIFHFQFRSLFRSEEVIVSPKPEEKGISPRNAFDRALPEAKKWQTDAALSFLTSDGESGANGRANSWRLIFTSKNPKVKNKGYQIKVNENQINSYEEIPYAGFAADFPADIMTPEQAIAEVHRIKGYENVPVLGIEAVYGPAEHVWYWAVRTPRAVISIEAKRKQAR